MSCYNFIALLFFGGETSFLEKYSIIYLPYSCRYLVSLVLFTQSPSPLIPSPSPSPSLFLSLSSFFLSSLHPLSSIFHHPLQLFAHPSQIIGNLLVHTLCILRTFCSHRLHLATHLRHHPKSLCKITDTSFLSLQKPAHEPYSILNSVTTSSPFAVVY